MPSINSVNISFSDDLVDCLPIEESGYDQKFESQDNSETYCGLGATDFPSHLAIPQSDWKDVARENDKYETWAENLRNRFTNQSPTHECVSHSFVQGFEAAWNAQRSGKDRAVFMSPLSLYAEANPGVRGGTSLSKLLGISMRRGVLPEHHGPGGQNDQKNRFKHTLIGTAGKGNAQNSSGKWVAVKNFPTGWKETAKFFRPLEVINPRSWEQIICLLLHGRVVCVGRNGHAIPYNQVVWRGGQLYAQYSDSYDILRYDSISNIRRGVGGSYCIWSTTHPDDSDWKEILK